MLKPDNVKAVRRFCAFVNYLAKFLPHLDDVIEPMRQLTHRETPWKWKHEHDVAFETESREWSQRHHYSNSRIQKKS